MTKFDPITHRPNRSRGLYTVLLHLIDVSFSNDMLAGAVARTVPTVDAKTGRSGRPRRPRSGR